MNKITLVFLTTLLMIAFGATAQAATRYSIRTGNWNATSTWSASSGGASGASVPVAGDDVVIERGYTVTVNVIAACATVTINAPNVYTILLITGSNTLTVSGNFVLAGSGTGTAELRFDYGSTGTVYLGGTFGGTNSVFGLTTSTGTVNYNGGDQTISRTTFYHLVLSGSGTKTMQVSANNKTLGNFTISGTASATLVQDFPVGGNLSVGNGAALDTATYTVNRSSGGGR